MNDANGPQVDRWRDLLSPSYHYPDDLADTAGEGLSGRKRRRAIRDARKNWREQDRTARTEWLTQRRREGEDETTSTGRLAVLVILALLILGLMITGWLRSNAGNDPSTDGAPPPAQPVPTPVTTSAQEEQPSHEPSTTSTSTDETSSPGAEVEEPAAVVEEWAAAWFTFDPATQSATDRLEAAGAYQADTLTDWLATQDTSAAYYLRHEATLSLDSADVQDAPPGAPVDTPTRVTLTVAITTTMTPVEGDPTTTVLPYVVTLERANEGAPWQVGWFEEGAHE